MNKIVVLDAHTVAKHEDAWLSLTQQGPCELFPHTAPEEVAQRIAQAELVLSNKVVLTAELIQQAKNLKYIGLLATGYNNVDIEAAKQRGIIVSNVPGYSTPNVSQHTFALILELSHRTGYHSQQVHQGEWAKSKEFCFWHYPQIELEGLTLGLIGFGRIARRTAEIAHAFGMKVLAHKPTPFVHKPDYVSAVSLSALLTQSDFVSLHCPLNPQTENIINESTLKQMKPTAFLINTSRGPLVNENDLAFALKNNLLAGAGLDVLTKEPPDKNNPLFGLDNCIITPHIAWASSAARHRMIEITSANVSAFLTGKPQNRIV